MRTRQIHMSGRAEGKKEIDAATQTQVEVKNIIIMRSASRQISPDYNDVDVENGGDTIVYRNGEMKKGTWKKKASDMFSLARAGRCLGW